MFLTVYLYWKWSLIKKICIWVLLSGSIWHFNLHLDEVLMSLTFFILLIWLGLKLPPNYLLYIFSNLFLLLPLPSSPSPYISLYSLLSLVFHFTFTIHFLVISFIYIFLCLRQWFSNKGDISPWYFCQCLVIYLLVLFGRCVYVCTRVCYCHLVDRGQ